eukprot:3695318-Amphidinium_carterae.1
MTATWRPQQACGTVTSSANDYLSAGSCRLLNCKPSVGLPITVVVIFPKSSLHSGHVLQFHPQKKDNDLHKRRKFSSSQPQEVTIGFASRLVKQAKANCIATPANTACGRCAGKPRHAQGKRQCSAGKRGAGMQERLLLHLRRTTEKGSHSNVVRKDALSREPTKRNTGNRVRRSTLCLCAFRAPTSDVMLMLRTFVRTIGFLSSKSSKQTLGNQST